ncbi:YDG domain-containing protein, partial [Bordetella pseudohinzii]
ITAAGKTYDGGTSAITSGALIGAIGSDNVALSASGSFADKNAGTGKQVNVSGVLTGADAGNYVLANVNTQTAADIARLSIAGALTAAGKTYDGSTSAMTSGALAGVLAGDDVALLTQGQFADRNAGRGKTVNVSGWLAGADAGNYALAANTVALADIAPRAITVTADRLGKRSGAADPTLTWRVTEGGLVEGDTLQGALSRAAGEALGHYRISAAALANSNYLISAVDGLLSISGVQADPRRDNAITAIHGARSAIPGLAPAQEDAPAPPQPPSALFVHAARPVPVPAGRILVIHGGVRQPDDAMGGI